MGFFNIVKVSLILGIVTCEMLYCPKKTGSRHLKHKDNVVEKVLHVKKIIEN